MPNGPEILEGSSIKRLKSLKKRAKRGEVEELRGAFGEPVFIRKSKGAFSPARRTVMEGIRRRKAKEIIRRVANLRRRGV